MADTPGTERTLDTDAQGVWLALQQALAGQHMTHFGGADAEGQRAERAVCGGMAVTADDGHAGLGGAQFGSDDMHDAAVLTVPAKQLDAILGAIPLQGFDLLMGLFGHIGPFALRVRRQCGSRVIDGGQAAVGPPHRQPAALQFGKGLRRRHLVQQVQVDVKDRGCAIAPGCGFLAHQVPLPYFLEQSGSHLSHGVQIAALSCGSVRSLPWC